MKRFIFDCESDSGFLVSVYYLESKAGVINLNPNFEVVGNFEVGSGDKQGTFSVSTPSISLGGDDAKRYSDAIALLVEVGNLFVHLKFRPGREGVREAQGAVTDGLRTRGILLVQPEEREAFNAEEDSRRAAKQAEIAKQAEKKRKARQEAEAREQELVNKQREWAIGILTGFGAERRTPVSNRFIIDLGDGRGPRQAAIRGEPWKPVVVRIDGAGYGGRGVTYTLEGLERKLKSIKRAQAKLCPHGRPQGQCPGSACPSNAVRGG